MQDDNENNASMVIELFFITLLPLIAYLLASNNVITPTFFLDMTSKKEIQIIIYYYEQWHFNNYNPIIFL